MAQSSVRSHSRIFIPSSFCSFCSVFHESFLVFELWAFEVFDFTDPPPTSNLYTLASFWVHVRLKFSILYRTKKNFTPFKFVHKIFLASFYEYKTNRRVNIRVHMQNFYEYKTTRRVNFRVHMQDFYEYKTTRRVNFRVHMRKRKKKREKS